jgi:hypothetical protein
MRPPSFNSFGDEPKIWLLVLFGGGGILLPLFGLQFRLFRGQSTLFVIGISALALVAGIVLGLMAQKRS